MADFFKTTDDETKVDNQQQTQEPVTQEPEKVKLGDKEYSQDELSKLVGLGETASELESKWNTPIDRLYPEYTKTTQELADMRRQQQEAETAKINEKASAGEELSPDELKAKVIAEADKMGIVHQGNVKQAVMEVLAARDLWTDTQAVIAQASSEGKPQTSEKDLLDFMTETGIKNPQMAYDIKFKPEIAQLEQTKVDSIKSEGLVTENTSTAGAKTPVPANITKDNLQDAILSVLQREG